jgi:hypothetical protein
MPFGLHSAAGTFQALVERLFTPDLEPYVFAYLDDIIVSTPDFETHLNILRVVFDNLKKAGLTLKESKCEFCKPELRYLGYVVNRQGLNVDSAKVSAVVDIPQPKGIRDVRRLIAMMSWYRRFVANFSTMVAPLTNLTRKKNTLHVDSGVRKSLFGNKKRLIKRVHFVVPQLFVPLYATV